MRTRILALAMLAAVILSGCAVQPPAADKETAALRLYTEEYPPLNFMAAGEVSGLATEVVRALATRTATPVEIRLTDWDEGYQAALQRPDTALYATVMTPARKGSFQWVGPLAVLDTNFYALKSVGIRIADLDAARQVGKIATVAGYYSEQVLRQEGFSNLVTSADEAGMLARLLAGEAQLLVSSNTALPAVLRRAGVDPAALEKVFTLSTDLAYVAFSPATSAGLVARWQAALDGMKRDGSFRHLYARWLPGESAPGIYQLVTEEYPPVTFVEDGRPAGFVTDVVREIARRLGVADDIRTTSWKNAYGMARLHPNVVLFSAERTPAREALFQWVGPVGENSAVLYARKGAGIRLASLDEARQVGAIATTTNWFTEQYLKERGFRNLVSAPDPVDNVRQLLRGEAELSIFTDITVPALVRTAGHDMAELEPALTVSRTRFYIALSRDTPAEVARAWQATLDDMKRDGSFERIYRAYLPDADLDGLLATAP